MQRLLVASVVAVVGLASCGSDGDESGPAGMTGSSFAAQASHIHGLGINPANGALYIATHSGLFRSDPGKAGPVRVGVGSQDTMGFTVAGPNRFYGSGHPAPEEPGFPNLGLIESRDGGESWRTISLAGEADFHALRYAHGRIYGYNGLSGELMISHNGGRSWNRYEVPASVLDLAVDPRDPSRVLVSSEAGLLGFSERTVKWRELSDDIGLLAWPKSDSLYLADGEGTVSVSSDGGRSWQRRGQLPESPVAFIGTSETRLYTALGSGSIAYSANGGREWQIQIQPQ